MKQNFYQKVITFFLIFSAMASIAFGQDMVVKGKVSEENGDLLYGVNVTSKGTNQGTITNDKGEYSISVKKGSVLTFSYIGFQSKDVVANSAVLNVSLVAGESVLNEVVVTAFGMSKDKKALAYSVTQVDGYTIHNV